jgi:hypothetical protein
MVVAIAGQRGVIELQVHYTPNGKATSDRTKVGLIFSKDPSAREVRPSAFYNATLLLPAGSDNTSVPGEIEFLQDTTVWGLFPHTHLRGKAWDYKLSPDGTTTTILSVPHYDFNQQTYYMFKAWVPKGARITRLRTTIAREQERPNANVGVTWGDQTWKRCSTPGSSSARSPRRHPLPPRKREARGNA